MSKTGCEKCEELRVIREEREEIWYIDVSDHLVLLTEDVSFGRVLGYEHPAKGLSFTIILWASASGMEAIDQFTNDWEREGLAAIIVDEEFFTIAVLTAAPSIAITTVDDADEIRRFLRDTGLSDRVQWSVDAGLLAPQQAKTIQHKSFCALMPSNNGNAAERPNRHQNCFRNFAAGSFGR